MISSLSGLLGVFLANHYQIKRQRLEAEHKEKIEIEKYQRETKERTKELIRSKLEVAHQIASRIAFENSQTSSYMASEMLSIDDFHKRYQENQLELEKLVMIIGIYFPSLNEEASILIGKTNVFWGYQMNYMATGAHNSMAVGEILKASEAIAKTTKVMKKEMENIAKKLEMSI
ncbi:hypothetical protein [Serpens gallinarum]|uniref:Uncharacterized protein n=1 Tax=Serpens gallinarum TaxID=2763075 RepID=A0ABR8TTD0_9PSED|nr:hypothetical protein [Serpens gallinarum]MBD7979010.1 hypothetical protein [Serpens gallinarum]